MIEYLKIFFDLAMILGYFVQYSSGLYLIIHYVDKRIQTWMNPEYTTLKLLKEVASEHPLATTLLKNGILVMVIGMIGSYFV